MKFLAILKDSLREAIDSKVFYVMIGLSALLTLITATLSFTPRSGEKLIQVMAISLIVDDVKDLQTDRLMHLAMNPGFKAYEVKSATPASGMPEGPESPHVVTLVVHCQSPAEADKVRAQPAETINRIKQRFGSLDELRVFDVTDARLVAGEPDAAQQAPSKTDVVFEVDVQPTKSARRLWPHEPALFFGALPLPFMREFPLGMQLFLMEDKIVNGLGAWIAILLSIIITAFFIPNMLRKGTVDLLLVKPIHRTSLLLCKFVGGLIFIFLNTSVAVLGVWLALGLRSGIWAPSFLLTVLVISAFFAILYAVSTLFAVLTRSPIAAILLTILAWFVLYTVGALYQFGEGLRQQEERRAASGTSRPEEAKPKATRPPRRVQIGDKGEPAKRDESDNEESINEMPEMPFRSDNWFFQSVRAIHFVLPRTRDLDHLMSVVLIRDLLTDNQIKSQKLDDTRISWGESLTVSGIFVGLMLGLSCFWFATRDY
jgi:ABC-type transport system involved in multi-copper enzyme maturation permease subunit